MQGSRVFKIARETRIFLIRLQRVSTGKQKHWPSQTRWKDDVTATVVSVKRRVEKTKMKQNNDSIKF